MSMFVPDPQPHPIHTVHRVGAGALGGFLVVFGLFGLTLGPQFLSATGPVVMGLSTNGLLSTLSLIVGAVLGWAALRGGPVASTLSVVVGAGFLVSGVCNALLLGSPMSMLAFRMSNVIFSLLVGAALLCVGAYGRFTGNLPATSPYAPAAQPPAPLPHLRTDGAVERAMAEAERAAARHTATPEQLARVTAAAAHRTQQARRDAFAGAC